MDELSKNELSQKLAWAREQVSQLETQCENWRNQALLAQARVRALEAANNALLERVQHSLPLFDPDELIVRE